jgi:hypothetical protein
MAGAAAAVEARGEETVVTASLSKQQKTDKEQNKERGT